MERNTIILYQPQVDYKPYYPCFWAPLSILSIAAPLVANGFKVILLDGNLQEHGKDKEIVKQNIKKCICVGISSMIGGNQLTKGLNFSRFVKNQKPKVPMVWGGQLATSIPLQLVNSPLVDFVVRGQGEQPMLDIVDSIIYRDNGRQIYSVITKDNKDFCQKVFLDKNTFPPYPWELLDIEKYIRTTNQLGKRVLNYVSSQGCPYGCGYCSEVLAYNCRWTALSSQRVLEEIQYLKQNYKLDGIKFYDANFFVNPKRVIEFSSGLLNANLQLNWGASAHPRDVIKLTDNLRLIKESGLSRLLIGAESGLQNALDYINKKCTVEDNLFVAELCAKNSIPAAFTFIVGIPGIKDDLEATLGMALEMKRISSEFDIKIHFYAPFPGTPLSAEAQRLGYKYPDTLQEWSKYDYYLIQTPWINKKEEKKVRRFGDFYCEFLYPPTWFLETLSSKPISKKFYKILQKLVGFRCKIHFYSLPFEISWFKKITGKDNFLV